MKDEGRKSLALGWRELFGVIQPMECAATSEKTVRVPRKNHSSGDNGTREGPSPRFIDACDSGCASSIRRYFEAEHRDAHGNLGGGFRWFGGWLFGGG